MALKLIDAETHRRKWGVVISRLPGKAGESEVDKRKEVLQWGSQSLKVPDKDIVISACHRLSKVENAPIIVVFWDLSVRNNWLWFAKNLKNNESRVSIQPDLPPCLMPLKKDILNQCHQLPQTKRKDSSIKYHPVWPYVSLVVKGVDKPLLSVLKKKMWLKTIWMFEKGIIFYGLLTIVLSSRLVSLGVIRNWYNFCHSWNVLDINVFFFYYFSYVSMLC